MSRTRRARQTIKRSLGVLKAFSVTIGNDIAFKIDVEALDGVADSGDLAEDMRDVLVEVGEAAKAHETGFALALDELQFLPSQDYEALIIGLHRAKQKGLPVALVGAGLPLLPELTGATKTYAERGFEFRTIGALGPTAAREALTRPAQDQGVSWEEAAVERVLEITEGYPFFIQEYGRGIWRLGSGERITAAQVTRSEPLIREYLDSSFFAQRIGKLPEGERNYVAAMAYLGDGPQRTGAVAEKLGKVPQAVSRTRQRLLEAAAIYAPAHGYVDFTVPMCADHIRRNYPDPRRKDAARHSG